MKTFANFFSQTNDVDDVVQRDVFMNIKTIIFFVNYAPRFQSFDSLTDQTRRPKEGDQYSQRPEALIIV